MRLIRKILPDNTKFDFIKLRFWAFGFTAFLTLATIASITVKGFNLGIDFQGGILLEVKTKGPADLGQMRGTLSALGLGEVALQDFGAPDAVLIRIQRQPGGEAAQQAAVVKVKEALGTGYDYRRTEFVGPKVGEELMRGGILATVLAVVSIVVYVWFRFEWQFGLGAMVATIHDVLTTFGLFSVAGLEFNLTIVAAILTIAGYSINDTVVQYDRVRENLRRYKKMSLYEVINRSINETLSRTILTSSTVFVASLALFLFGGEVLHGFSLAMLWGVIIGTYSSIYVAMPMLIYFNLRRSKMAGDEEEAAAQGAGKP